MAHQYGTRDRSTALISGIWTLPGVERRQGTRARRGRIDGRRSLWPIGRDTGPITAQSDCILRHVTPGVCGCHSHSVRNRCGEKVACSVHAVVAVSAVLNCVNLRSAIRHDMNIILLDYVSDLFGVLAGHVADLVLRPIGN